MKAPGTTGQAATRWRLEPAHSSAEFRVPHFWRLLKVKGHFDRLDGWLELKQNGDRRLELIIDAASLSTGNRKRDEHLRAADFFDTEQHPEVRFHSTAVSDAADGRLHVEGELMAAGRRVPLQLDATVEEAEGQLQIEASTTLDQRELGMTWSPLGIARTPSTLSVRARLRRER
jgi:polyisoprenoid-binding protein YceI